MEQQRLFLALIPPEEIKQQINNNLLSLVNNYNKNLAPKLRLVAAENYHITLLFLGNVSTNLTQDIISNINSIQAKKFILAIDQSGYFKRSKVFWFGPRHTPPELDYLLDGLEISLQRITQLGLDFFQPRSFSPHITVLKKVIDIHNYPELSKSTINLTWSVDKFYLVKSLMTENGVKYEVINEFELY